MQQMIRIKPKNGHLSVEVSGKFDFSKAKAHLQLIIETSYQHNLLYVLVDIRKLRGPVHLTDRFRLAEFLVQKQTQPIKMAIVGSDEQEWNDRFFEDVAHNRGGIVKVTNDLDEAQQWLGCKAGLPSDIGNNKITKPDLKSYTVAI